MIDKRFIFTVTTGRTGTLFMANLLPIFKGVTGLHEPEPKFVHHLREVQTNPKIAKDFLINEKVPAICRSVQTPIYLETGHYFCKCYFEPWLEIGEFPTPDLILLDRDWRKIALSFLALNAIPARTEKGLKHFVAPFDPTCYTRLEDWEKLTDYQLCYWYCLEIEERKKQYSRMVQARGGHVLATSIKRIQTIEGILDARSKLAFAPLSLRGWLSYFRRRKTQLNQKVETKAKITFDPGLLDDWEAETRQKTIPSGRSK